MIDRLEFLELAREFSLRPDVVEKDYALPSSLLMGYLSALRSRVGFQIWSGSCRPVSHPASHLPPPFVPSDSNESIKIAALPEIVWVSEVFEDPRPPWGRGLGEGVCRPGRERRTDVRVQGLGKPARQRLSQGGVKDPRVRGPPDARGRPFRHSHPHPLPLMREKELTCYPHKTRKRQDGPSGTSVGSHNIEWLRLGR